jgi:small subunit ribosomal protein S13
MIISGKVINDAQAASVALRGLYGLNRSRAIKLCALLGLRPGVMLRLNSRRQELSKISRDHVPKDHAKFQRDRIQHLVDLKHNRGLRHMFGLPCRGQRSRTNASTAKRLGTARRATGRR